MGLHTMGPPEELISVLLRWNEYSAFVETGTFQGETTAWAAERFPRVTTIELSTAYHSAALKRFGGRGHIQVLQGESPRVLQEIVPGLGGNSLFWLDAHWSGMDTAGKEAECPLLAELAVINSASVLHTVLVDDARLFCAPPPLPHRAGDWPDLAATVDALGNGGRRYVVLFRDVFVAVPLSEKERLMAWLQSAGPAKRSVGRMASLWRKIGT